MRFFLNCISKKMNNIYLKKKLIILYLICAVLPISVLSLFLLTETRERLLALSDSQIQSNNQTNRSMLLSVTSLAASISKIIASDEEFIKIVSTDFANDKDVYTAYRNFTLLNEFINNHIEITDIRIYISNPTVVTSGRYYQITEDIINKDWYQALSPQNQAEITWIHTDSFSNDASLYLVRKVTIPNSDYYAILIIGISNTYFSLINHNQLQSTYISLDDGCVFYSTDNIHIGTVLNLTPLLKLRGYLSSLYKFNGHKILAMESTLKAFSSPQNFHIITISNDYQQIMQTLVIITVIILIVTFVPLLLFVTFSDRYSSRLLKVREQMHQIAHGNLQIEDNFLGTDELGQLFHDMKATITEIQELHQRLLKEQKEKDQIALRQQQMQFELLASQVNPHFLFNTLETIRMHALLANQTELNNIIFKLGQTLRYSLETPSTTTTLANELKYLEDYLEIQHFRFQDKLNYSIQIHPNLNLQNIVLLPFILQPIVENAVIHGFSTKKKGGMIEIKIFTRNNNLLISISDNGCGIPDDKLKKLNQELSSYKDTINTSHIGMHNVNNRIKLYYGPEYGLHLESTVGKGTIVTIQIPYKEVNGNESTVYR